MLSYKRSLPSKANEVCFQKVKESGERIKFYDIVGLL